MARVHVTQRYGGHKDAGSSTARILTRLGELAVVALFALTCLAVCATEASANGRTADPSPQPAPAASHSTPAPDPAPQADTRAVSSHSSAPATPSTHVTTPTTASGTRSAESLSPHIVAAGSASVPPSTSARLHPASSPSRHASRAPVHRVRAERHAAAQLGSLAFPLSLPRDLLLFPRAALRAGDPTHRNGVLLLLSSVAMAVVAVAGFTLLRRLRGMESA
ncbi:MAG TPA: hypothetical protein VMA77_12365 [Solirubrobacteraceae bacterium]|nr:hypothetical protein [Solirubrobacteraceae bacterium]